WWRRRRRSDMTETPSSVMTTVAQPFAPAPPRLVPPKLRLDPFGSLRRHRVVAISVFIVLFGATLPVAWWKGRPRFTSAAVVFVSPRFVANLEGNKEFELQSNSEYREYVQQNVRTINRFDIIEEAVESLGQNQSLWQKSGESITHATERLQHALAVAPVPDTYQIVV